MNGNGYGEFVEVEATPEQRAKAELRQMIEAGNLGGTLKKAKEMLAVQEAKDRADRKSQALDMIAKTKPGEPLDLRGIIGALEMGCAYAEDGGDKYDGLFKPVSEISPRLPAPILGALGVGGAVLTAGNVCVISGQGGVAKSTMTVSIALSFAACTEMENKGMVPLRGGIFRGTGGRVMIASFEDSENTISYRLQGLANIWQEQGKDNRIGEAIQDKILCADFPEPLFRGEGFDLPEPTRAWHYLWETARMFKPKLIIIDPIIGAYMGDGNIPPRVFAFVKAIAREAGQIGAGILLVGHSNKAARQSANHNPFGAGHIAGTGAWTDAARGAMMMTKDMRDGNKGKTVLAIAKANFGPSYIETHIRPIYRDGDGMPYGMEIDGAGWSGDNDNTQNESAEGASNGDQFSGVI